MISSDKILKFTLILFIIKVYIVACKIIIIAVQFTLLIINEKRQCDEIDKLLKWKKITTNITNWKKNIFNLTNILSWKKI